MATERTMGYGRGALIGGALGFPTVAAIVASIALMAGFELTSALGIGAFAALWGGFGLGSMMGAIVVVTREMRDTTGH
jgi:hypothetical protein